MKGTYNEERIEALKAKLGEMLKTRRFYYSKNLKETASILEELAERLEAEEAESYIKAEAYGIYAVNHIQAHFSERVSIEELASQIGISRGYLTRLVKDITGMSPKQYLINVRMVAAADYLKEGAMSIGEIAEACGYEDPLALSKAFRRHYGISPTEYRTGSSQDTV